MIANKIYVAKNFSVLPSYLRIAKEIYKAGIQNVNFADNKGTANLINRWVEDQTNKKIQNLVSPGSLSASTKLVLVNTIYLNAKWVIPFPTYLTDISTFHLRHGSTKNVSMMRSNDERGSVYKYLNSSELGATFLQMDFQQSNLSMTFVLPNKGKYLEDIESNVEDYLEPLNYTKTRVSVAIPRFEINSGSMNLVDYLKKVRN